MATVTFELQVQGGGEVELGVAILGDTPVVLNGIEQKSIAFEISNPLTRPVVLALSVIKEGPAKDKATVSLLNDSMTITPGATGSNQVIIESTEDMLEGDDFVVRVEGSEGV